ncbi:hypothetical protein EYF80_063156 [Liparis tanakae]|uniref:Uncharacterized protein n=1 Tax=Liparis tanakae TaxID=230148 RepID=A0A4Z2ECS8_9TELE|nr:hypothetical protein EYF80_063156 [Liparis tanakae]
MNTHLWIQFTSETRSCLLPGCITDPKSALPFVPMLQEEEEGEEEGRRIERGEGSDDGTGCQESRKRDEEREEGEEKGREGERERGRGALLP